jgi:hypothetical protein
MQTKLKETGRGGRRPGAGRKPISREQDLKKHTVYLTDSEWEACMCNSALGITPAEYIRHIIQHAQKQRLKAGTITDHRHINPKEAQTHN